MQNQTSFKKKTVRTKAINIVTPTSHLKLAPDLFPLVQGIPCAETPSPPGQPTADPAGGKNAADLLPLAFAAHSPRQCVPLGHFERRGTWTGAHPFPAAQADDKASAEAEVKPSRRPPNGQQGQ